MSESYNILIKKLDEFTRKYYKNQLIKGGLYCLALLLVFYLAVNILEYIGHFGIIERTIIFYVYLLINIGILWRFVIISLLKLYKIGKLISDEFAAEIIGKHFEEVKDKLLNTLQLRKLLPHPDPLLKTGEGIGSVELLEAGINQKIGELKPVPFASAIDLKGNKKYLKYPLIPLAVIVIILLTSPTLLKEPSDRLLNHSVYYEKKAPFQFNILNNTLEAIQQEDYKLEVKLTGDEIPDKAFIVIDNVKFQLDKESTIMFHYNFRNIQRDTKFELEAENIKSKEFLLKVLPKPIVLNFSSELNYPKYIGKKDEALDNTGDLIVPEGTRVTWKFYTKDTKKVIMRFGNEAIGNRQQAIENTKILTSNGSPMFTYSGVFKGNQNYSISMQNEFLKNKDSLEYSINVIPDAYPTIDLQEHRDTLYDKHYYFNGTIKDDYGFSKLTFDYIHKTQDTSNKKQDIILTAIPIDLTANQQQFYYYFDISTLTLKPGEEIEYYFEVWDNDGVNGAKSTRSQKKIYREPTSEEQKAKSDKASNDLKNTMEQSMMEAKQIQDQAEDLNRKFVEKKSLGWQEQKQLQDLMERERNLQKKVEGIKQMNNENKIKEDEYNKPENEEILQKQEELKKMFDQMMTDEMKKLFNQYQDLLKKMDKDKANEMLDKMKFTNEDLKKELERNLQIMKELEFEKKLQDAIDKLNELAKNEDKLSEETKEQEKQKEPGLNGLKDLQDKQLKNNSEFKDFRKDLNEAKDKNKELEKPNNMKNTDQQENSIQNEMQNSLNSLQQNSFNKASKSQKNSSQQMKDLAKDLQNMKDEMSAEQEGEDYDKLRSLLENLVRVSFEQEANMQKLKVTMRTDPQYLKIMNDQKKIKDELQMIEDTLYAISKREAQIQSFVNKKITEINRNVEKTLTSLSGSYTLTGLGESNRSNAMVSQQYSMTGINDLALMLSEALDQMQESMSQKECKNPSSCSKPKKNCKKPGSCSKPGGNGKKKMASMRKMQEELNKRIEQLKNGMNPYGNSQSQQQKMNEQLARYAAEQEAIRKQLQDMAEDLKNSKDGRNNFNSLMNQMEQTETDLVNKLISQETLNRQKQIVTRLLESEKAEIERETDPKRESTEAKNQNFSNPNKFFEYNKEKGREDEMLKTSLPTLKPFYKNKVNEYFYQF